MKLYNFEILSIVLLVLLIHSARSVDLKEKYRSTEASLLFERYLSSSSAFKNNFVKKLSGQNLSLYLNSGATALSSAKVPVNLFILDTTVGNKIDTHYPSAAVEIVDNQFKIYEAPVDATEKLTYRLTLMRFLDDDIMYSFKQLKMSKKNHIKSHLHKFINKLEEVERQVNPLIFEKSCRIVFVLKNDTKPDISGNTVKKQCLVICFPSKANGDEILKAFQKLLFAKFLEAVRSEKNAFNFPILGLHRDMGVYFFSPYMMKGSNKPKSIKITYLNLNENGFTYNEQRILDPTTIIATYRYSQLETCTGRPLDEDTIDLIPPDFRKQFSRKPCCRVFTVDWNGRSTKEVVCVASKDPNKCEIKQKILISTIYRYCFKAGVALAAAVLMNKGGLALKGVTPSEQKKIMNILNEMKEIDLKKAFGPDSAIAKVGEQIQAKANSFINKMNSAIPVATVAKEDIKKILNSKEKAVKKKKPKPSIIPAPVKTLPGKLAITSKPLPTIGHTNQPSGSQPAVGSQVNSSATASQESSQSSSPSQSASSTAQVNSSLKSSTSSNSSQSATSTTPVNSRSSSSTSTDQPTSSSSTSPSASSNTNTSSSSDPSASGEKTTSSPNSSLPQTNSSSPASGPSNGQDKPMVLIKCENNDIPCAVKNAQAVAFNRLLQQKQAVAARKKREAEKKDPNANKSLPDVPAGPPPKLNSLIPPGFENMKPEDKKKLKDLINSNPTLFKQLAAQGLRIPDDIIKKIDQLSPKAIAGKIMEKAKDNFLILKQNKDLSFNCAMNKLNNGTKGDKRRSLESLGGQGTGAKSGGKGGDNNANNANGNSKGGINPQGGDNSPQEGNNGEIKLNLPSSPTNSSDPSSEAERIKNGDHYPRNKYVHEWDEEFTDLAEYAYTRHGVNVDFTNIKLEKNPTLLESMIDIFSILKKDNFHNRQIVDFLREHGINYYPGMPSKDFFSQKEANQTLWKFFTLKGVDEDEDITFDIYLHLIGKNMTVVEFFQKVGLNVTEELTIDDYLDLKNESAQNLFQYLRLKSRLLETRFNQWFLERKIHLFSSMTVKTFLHLMKDLNIAKAFFDFFHQQGVNIFKKMDFKSFIKMKKKIFDQRNISLSEFIRKSYMRVVKSTTINNFIKNEKIVSINKSVISSIVKKLGLTVNKNVSVKKTLENFLKKTGVKQEQISKTMKNLVNSVVSKKSSTSTNISKQVSNTNISEKISSAIKKVTGMEVNKKSIVENIQKSNIESESKTNKQSVINTVKKVQKSLESKMSKSDISKSESLIKEMKKQNIAVTKENISKMVSKLSKEDKSVNVAKMVSAVSNVNEAHKTVEKKMKELNINNSVTSLSDVKKSDTFSSKETDKNVSSTTNTISKDVEVDKSTTIKDVESKVSNTSTSTSTNTESKTNTNISSNTSTSSSNDVSETVSKKDVKINKEIGGTSFSNEKIEESKRNAREVVDSSSSSTNISTINKNISTDVVNNINSSSTSTININNSSIVNSAVIKNEEIRRQEIEENKRIERERRNKPKKLKKKKVKASNITMLNSTSTNNNTKSNDEDEVIYPPSSHLLHTSSVDSGNPHKSPQISGKFGEMKLDAESTMTIYKQFDEVSMDTSCEEKAQARASELTHK